MQRSLTALSFAIVLLAAPTTVLAETFNIYVGGMCSTQFQGGKGGGYIHDLPGTEVEAFIDQRYNHDTAVVQFKNQYLDVYCTNGNVCRLLGYSNGSAVISKALAVYGPYNVIFGLMSGSNEGGSELSDTGWVAEIIGGCSLGSRIAPGDHRPTWNHHATGGALIYALSGRKGFGAWYDPRRATSAILPGEDDGAVAMHSGVYSAAGSRNDGCASGRWTNHHPAYWCAFDLDHYQIKMRAAQCYAAGGCNYK